MAIVHFIDEKGSEQWGIEKDEKTASLLAKDPVFGVEALGQTATISQRLAPVVPTNIFAIGLNYRRHAEETGAQIPRYPVVFMKPTTTVIGFGDTIRLPACALRGPEVDYECELAVVIGKHARDVSSDEALDYVYGYTCANDVSARRWQKHAGSGQWVRGKSFDTFCPLGPRLLLAEEIADPQALSIRSVLNGNTMQESNTADMIFSVAELIAFLSQDTTLLPGTLILTGTPEGVGFVRTPPVFMAPGDEITIEIEGIGKLTNPVEQA